MSKIAFILVVISFLSSARSQTWTGPNQLQPVHGLYVKPSSDGTTGDLYVAATEDSGTKAQWLTDQPINFLPAAASTSQATASQPISIAYPAYPGHDESSSPQKRAVITPPVAPVQYTYALPFNSAEGAQMPYPYAIPTTSSTPESSATQCEKAAAATTAVPYNPFQFFYPHMMQAYANARTVLKESGISDEKASSVIPQPSPFWPSSYSYPSYPMYMMVDPSAWAHYSQSAQTAANAANAESSPK